MKGKPTGFWAKLNQDEDGNILEWHPLMAHLADVAAVVEALLERTILHKRLATILGWKKLSDIHIARLSVLAALHDAGKVNHGFQNKMYSSKHPRAGHVSPIIELLDADAKYQESLLIPLGIQQMLSWFPEQKTAIHFLMATWGHHGRPVPIKHDFKASLWKENEERNPEAALQELGDAIKTWCPKAFDTEGQPFPSNTAFQHTFNGLLTLADWLGSDPKFFKFSEYDSGYIEVARKNASHVIDKLVLDPEKSRLQFNGQSAKFDRFCDFKPFDIQKECLELPLFENGSLTILESDTGSGKTESAIARFMRLYQKGLVDGMYFAVPTRSAATQLYERVVEATRRAFPDESSRPPVVQAVSGYIKVDAEEGKPLPNFDVLWPENRRDLLRERGWAAEHPKRYLAGAIVVGTIDQVFLSTLQVNHAHMRAAALLRHFLVVDEVHASDAYMTKLLDRVLDFHLSAGGHALLMSATLGTASRYHLSTNGKVKPPEPEEAKQIPYPLLTHVDASRKKPETTHAASSGQQKKVETETKPIAGSAEKIASLAVDYADSGARVLIIRNLVRDCIETQKAVEEITGSDSDLLFQINGEAAPHHSRFAADDRRLLDGQIENYFGKKTNRKSVIAVATQTVEQSLDIDADLLITDLCPMDVLLQRIGRLHRHKRDRPQGFETARCVVLTPEQRDVSESIDQNGKGSKGKHGLGTVYQDLRVLEATWRVLEDEALKQWNIPEHNRELVECATHPNILRSLASELGDRWENHQQHIAGQEFANRQLPGLVGIDFSKPFGDSGFAEDLKQVKTRLGRDDYQVFLPENLSGPFGNEVKEMTITEWQLDVVPEKLQVEEDTVQTFDGGFGFTYYGKAFRYDRFGLHSES
ncbi:MAG: CRISPR-associated helicase Cas3' [Bacteroidetes bacterium]|jgi:CRISPR-associated endonuclease/helicase Cas3|nr:CRISPR-associated helicase Cas3' [Bacteroidota bacterium]